jgi:hypothetical protein
MKRMRRRLGQAALEAGLIVFAILTALGVDEYWETREERALAETAIERIAAEVLANRSDLLDSRESNLTLMADLASAITSLEAGEGPGLSGVNYEVSLLGDDAWQTAQVTGAVHFMDFDQVGRISMVYRVQQLYLDRQAPIVDDVANLGSGELADSFSALRRGISITLALECDLVVEYDTLLAELVPEVAVHGEASADCR